MEKTMQNQDTIGTKITGTKTSPEGRLPTPTNKYCYSTMNEIFHS